MTATRFALSEAMDDGHSVDFGRLDQPKMNPLVEFASEHVEDEPSQRQHYTSDAEHLSLERPGYAHELLLFSAMLAWLADQLVVAIERAWRWQRGSDAPSATRSCAHCGRLRPDAIVYSRAPARRTALAYLVFGVGRR